MSHQVVPQPVQANARVGKASMTFWEVELHTTGPWGTESTDVLGRFFDEQEALLFEKRCEAAGMEEPVERQDGRYTHLIHVKKVDLKFGELVKVKS